MASTVGRLLFLILAALFVGGCRDLVEVTAQPPTSTRAVPTHEEPSRVEMTITARATIAESTIRETPARVTGVTRQTPALTGGAVTPTPAPIANPTEGQATAPVLEATGINTVGQNTVPIPLTDMANVSYYGFQGGLYPDGLNEMPPAHTAEGVERARAVQPLDQAGNPDPDGRIVMLSVGMSNTSMEFCRALGPNSPTDGVTCADESFMGLANEDPAVDRDDLVIVNGARGGQIADRWDTADEQNYDRIRDMLLAPLGLSERQVQVIWLKVANVTSGNPPSLPETRADAYLLLAHMADTVRSLAVRYPNLQQVFLSSRIYAGNATRDLSTEPYAYETGFAVKWLIEAQIRQMAANGDRIDPLAGDLDYETTAPWLAWGPYLWADGTAPRADGLVWRPEDFGDDGTHPSISGREKVGVLLLEFFKSSSFTTCWFVAGAGPEACEGGGEELVAVADTPRPRATVDETGQAPGPTHVPANIVPLSAEAQPLTEMSSATYLGFEGGLYPDGANAPPPEHAAEGLARAQAIQPLDPQGNPHPAGKIVLLSIGMSNTLMEFCGRYVLNTNCEPYSFIGKAMADPEVDRANLQIVNGARGAQIASRWDAPDERIYDQTRDRFLAPLGLTEEQVQVVWLKVTDFLQGQPSLPAESAQAYTLQATMGNIVRALKVRYPNLQQVFLSSRSYAGYAKRDLSPEPYAYETGFAVKWLIESQIEQMASGRTTTNSLAGDLNYNTVVPWLAWGPYLWADGARPRAEDGLVWLPEDFSPEDGTHPSTAGREKVANLLLDFFKSSPYTSCWFTAAGDCSTIGDDG